jgi:hypothetical protein
MRDDSVILRAAIRYLRAHRMSDRGARDDAREFFLAERPTEVSSLQRCALHTAERRLPDVIA